MLGLAGSGPMQGQTSTPALAAPTTPTTSGTASPTAPAATVTAALTGGVIKGTVAAGTAGKPGGVPLPGVAVTATNTLTGRK